jgi:hypothetical protein
VLALTPPATEILALSPTAAAISAKSAKGVSPAA